jgi:hypothetical protein
MRSAIAEYLNTYTPFELFGVSHWASILLFLFLVIWLISASHISYTL